MEIGDLRGKLREKIVHSTRESPYPLFRIREPRHFIGFPRYPDISKVSVTYPLIEPFVTATVQWDGINKQLKYTITEPLLSAKEKTILDTLKSHLTELIDVKISTLPNQNEAIAYLETKLKQVVDDLGIDLAPEPYMRFMYFLFRDFVGLNEIEPLMHDPYIEDIGCAGTDTPIYIAHRKFGQMITSVVYRDPDALANFIIKLSEKCGRYISYATPLFDGTLPEGSRIQASLSKDVTTKGPTFSIRRFRRNPFSPVDLLNLKTLSTSMAAYLWFLIESNASILVAGGVSTGKTTLLNCLSMFIPPEKKVVSIEDVREINISHDNWIPATTRTGFGMPEGGRRYGEVTLFDLLKESFRMKPDYVIVGEVRGKEAYVLFQGMASGNPSLGTIHAGSVEDVIKRLQTPPIDLSPSLIEALDVIIITSNASEVGESARRVKEVVEVESMDEHSGKAHTEKVFSWIPSQDDYKDDTEASLLLRQIAFERGMSFENIQESLRNRMLVLEWMRKYQIVQYEDACAIINMFYKDKLTLLSWVKDGKAPPKIRKQEKMSESVTGLSISQTSL